MSLSSMIKPQGCIPSSPLDCLNLVVLSSNLACKEDQCNRMEFLILQFQKYHLFKEMITSLIHLKALFSLIKILIIETQ